MPLRDSLSESLPFEAMLKAVRQCAEGEPCWLTVAGFKLRLRPERVSISPRYSATSSDVRLKILSTFLLRLSRTWKQVEFGAPFPLMFELGKDGMNVAVVEKERGTQEAQIAWFPCEIERYEADKKDDPPVITLGNPDVHDGRELRRIVL